MIILFGFTAFVTFLSYLKSKMPVTLEQDCNMSQVLAELTAFQHDSDTYINRELSLLEFHSVSVACLPTSTHLSQNGNMTR